MNLKIDRTTKLRWRRRFKQRRRQVEELGVQAEDQFERNIVRRVPHLWRVRRFLLSWLLLLLLLIGGTVTQINDLGRAYQQVAPVPGGTYTEGILGVFTNANPLYATSAVDVSVSHLVFAGLFKFDETNRLVPDLASGYSVNEKGDVYTVKVKPNLTWQDGHPLTAKDVLFTYKTIQNPDAKSPLQSSWRGITVEAKDAYTIIFTLPNSLSSFPYSMVNGIVPEHLLKNIPVAELRSATFNTANPVGAGPFKWSTIEVIGNTAESREERIALDPFANYYAGRPKLDRFIVRAIHNQTSLKQSFERQEITGAAGLQGGAGAGNPRMQEHSVPLSGAVMVFFKNSQPPFTDVTVRKALVLAADRGEVINSLGYPAISVQEPFLKGMVGYDPLLQQKTGDRAEAEKLLDAAGWKVGTGGIRTKGGQPLQFQLYAEDTPEYGRVTQKLQNQWNAVGVDAKINKVSQADLQTNVSLHEYDALVFGIALGVDPDVYAYWHSTQAANPANRLALSEYRSAVADKALEAGRTRADPTLRAVKYKPFLQAWRDDAPALALYQPRFLYLTNTTLYNFDPTVLNSGQDRYANVNNWMIKESKGLK